MIIYLFFFGGIYVKIHASKEMEELQPQGFMKLKLLPIAPLGGTEHCVNFLGACSRIKLCSSYRISSFLLIGYLKMPSIRINMVSSIDLPDFKV